MTTKYEKGHEVPGYILASRLDELSGVIVKRDVDWKAEFTLRVPAEVDRDADLVLSEAARRIRHLESERDALAAHVERLADLVQASINGIEWYRDRFSDDFGEADEEHLTSCRRALEELEETPTASLARLIAEKQADGMKRAAAIIEKKADDYDAEHGSTDPSTGAREYPRDGAEYYDDLMELAEELRRQAEGGE